MEKVSYYLGVEPATVVTGVDYKLLKRAITAEPTDPVLLDFFGEVIPKKPVLVLETPHSDSVSYTKEQTFLVSITKTLVRGTGTLSLGVAPKYLKVQVDPPSLLEAAKIMDSLSQELRGHAAYCLPLSTGVQQ
jgi:hypothetical protein